MTQWGKLRWAAIVALGLPPGGSIHAQEFWVPASLDSLVAAATADSNDPVRHHAVALAHLNRRKLAAAEQAFRAALGADSRYAPAFFGLALIGMERRPEMLRPPGKKPPPRALVAARDSVFAQYRHAFLLDPLVSLSLPSAPRDTTVGRSWFSNVQFATMDAYLAFLRGASGEAFALTQWVLGQYETFQVSGRIPSEVLWLHSLSGARLGRFEPGVRGLSVLVARAEREAQADTTGLPSFLEINDLRYMLAFFRAKAGQTWNAVTTYREVLVADLGFWVAHVRLADLFERLERWDEAVHERQQALELNPADPVLTFDLGLTLARSGRPLEADSMLALAVSAFPRVALIPYHRGELAWMRNDPRAARGAYETFLALAPVRLAEEIADAQVRLQVLRHQVQ